MLNVTPSSCSSDKASTGHTGWCHSRASHILTSSAAANKNARMVHHTSINVVDHDGRTDPSIYGVKRTVRAVSDRAIIGEGVSASPCRASKQPTKNYIYLHDNNVLSFAPIKIISYNK
jgi:hypothetical protein